MASLDSYGNYFPLPKGDPIVGTTASSGGGIVSGNGNPNTLGFTALPDTLYFNTDGSNTIYTTTDGTTWVSFAGGGGGSTQVYSGHGSPNGVVTATAPALYYDLDTGVLYQKTGGGNTGWN